MPTRWTQTLIPTLREVPAEAEVPSHRLMLRAGLIRKLGSGMYSYLPLGWRSLRKAMTIIREEMAAAGAEEVFLPAVVPLDLFKKTGRDEAYGDNLFRLKDRHGREQALGPTHEEVITDLLGSCIESYKDLPKTFYQIQTKFRDEFRPRFGVLRSREFQMKDAYSFHLDVEGAPGSGCLNEIYDKQYAAYCRIFERCGLPYEIVEAESGPIGGSASHEFMVPSPTGEDTILKSDKGNYAANVEKCEIGERAVSETFAQGRSRLSGSASAPPTGELEKVHTPNCASIEDVTTFFKKNLGTKLKTSNMLKSLVYIATRESDEADPTRAKDPWYVLAIVRGDHDANEGKLKQAVRTYFDEPIRLEMAPDAFAREDGWTLGFVGPHAAVARDDTYLIVDPDATIDQFWVTGANEVDYHVKHFHWQRDVLGPAASAAGRIRVADIRNAVDGDPSPRNDGGVLRETKGIEIGHVFKLGDKYTRAMDITVLTPDNQRKHPIMGCYGIGVNRILAAAIERNGGHDDNGIIWPPAIAPYTVLITTLKWDGRIREVAEQLATSLEAQQSPGTSVPDLPAIDVLIDDRDERPGVKFKDADLIGIPVRITVGEKGLADPGGAKVEIKARNGANGPKGELVPVDEAVARTIELLRAL